MPLIFLLCLVLLRRWKFLLIPVRLFGDLFYGLHNTQGMSWIFVSLKVSGIKENQCNYKEQCPNLFRNVTNIIALTCPPYIFKPEQGSTNTTKSPVFTSHPTILPCEIIMYFYQNLARKFVSFALQKKWHQQKFIYRSANFSDKARPIFGSWWNDNRPQVWYLLFCTDPVFRCCTALSTTILSVNQSQ